jgi:PIN domain nuclease of toxin-antitoxin system
LIAYLDTHVAVWLAMGKLKAISTRARKLMEKSDLILSPMALVELEYLFELGRCRLRAQDLFTKLEHEIGLRLSDLPFARVASAGLSENWTRDPFDRLIVAEARTNGLAWLISSDEHIAGHYPKTVW